MDRDELTKTLTMILNWTKTPLVSQGFHKIIQRFKPAFTIVIFIHYKPRIAVAILDF